MSTKTKSKVSEIYLDRLYQLFEKYHPSKYSRDYVNTILEENIDSQYECYKQYCSSFDEEPLPPIDDDKKDKSSKKKKKKKKKGNKKKKNKKKVKLEDLLNNDDDNKENDKKGNNLMVSNGPKIGPRKSIIGMLRKGLIIKNTEERQGKNNGDNDKNIDDLNIKCVVRVRPVNKREKEIEHRLLFRTELDMDDKDYDIFLKKRKELMNDTERDIKTMDVDNICGWLEEINFDSYKKRFRRRKINGEWLCNFPQYNEKKPLELDENTIIAFTKGNKSKRYEMDYVLKPTVTQNETFKLIGNPIIDNIIKGYNCTIFAFGQTGTGKTHTMFGWQPEPEQKEEQDEENNNDKDEDDDDYEITFTEEELGRHRRRDANDNTIPTKDYIINEEVDGLIPRILNELFIKLENDPDIAYFNIQCGFIEIYQEKLRDLIRPRLKIQLRYVGAGSELINLSWHDIKSFNDMGKLIEISIENRQTASTLQNKTSSRSHCIIQLKIEITLRDGTNQVNKISFGDLAGSEKLTKTGATGQRLHEAKKIVKSLFAIKKVIRALSEKKPFVPYQDSVLTKILRDSLGGNSLTYIVCTISPHAYNREETISTLRFAEMAKKIKNEAIVNRIVSRKEMELQINNLREQLQYLRKQRANTRKRFTSTDFRVLQSQLMDANRKYEEYQSRYLQSEIQLLIKTQYIQELEELLNKKNIQINSLKQEFLLLKENKININDIDINKFDMKDEDEDLDENDEYDENQDKEDEKQENKDENL